MSITTKELQLNRECLNKIILEVQDSDKYSIDDGQKNRITFSWEHNNQALFEIILFKDKNLKLKLLYFMNMHICLVEDMIFALKRYQEFTNRTIKFADYKLFGDILQTAGEFSVEGKRQENITATLNYWKNVRDVERKLKVRFNINSPISEYDSDMLSILIMSLIKNKPCKIKKLSDVKIKTKAENLKKIEGLTNPGDFKVIYDASGEQVCDQELKGCYKVLYYGPVSIKGHENDKKIDTNTIETELVFKTYDNTIAAEIYCTSEDEANKFLQQNEKLFRNAKYSWEYGETVKYNNTKNNAKSCSVV